MQKRFIFVKDYKCEYGTLKKDSTIEINKGFLYFNGGLIEPWWSDYLEKFVKDEMEHPNYLREIPIIYNKV